MKNKLNISILNIAILSMVIKTFMGSSNAIPSIGLLDDMLVVIYIICTVYLIIKKHYKVKTFVLIVLGSLLLLYTSVKINYSDPLITYLFILSIKDIDIDKIIQTIYKYSIIMLVIHALLTLILALMGEISMYTYDMSRGFRYTLGFAHPNTTGRVAFCLTCLVLWIREKKIKKLDVFGLLAFNVVIYSLCKSKTALIISILAIVLYVLAKQNKYLINKSINFVARFIFPSLSLLLYIAIKSFSNGDPVALLINKILTGRLTLAAYALDRVGITIIGQKIDFYGAIEYSSQFGLNSFTFDCLYSFLFYNMGILYALVITVLLYKLASKNNTKINIFIILWCLYGVTEVHGLNGFDFFPIFLLVLLIDKKCVDISTDKSIEMEGMLNG